MIFDTLCCIEHALAARNFVGSPGVFPEEPACEARCASHMHYDSTHGNRAMKKYRLAGSILALVLVACGQGAATLEQARPTAAPTGATKPATRELLPSPTPVREMLTVALNDVSTGQTLHLAVGDTFMLKLGDDYLWQVHIGDERVVTHLAKPGAKSEAPGPYLARAAGQTELQITGDPACSKASPPCAMPSILYELKIAVR